MTFNQKPPYQSHFKIFTFSNYEEAGEIHAKLLRTEIELSEKKEECGMLDQQVQQFQITLSQVTSQYQKVFF